MMTVAEALAYLNTDTSVAPLYASQLVDTSYNEALQVGDVEMELDLPWCKDLDIPFVGCNESISGKTNIAINLPLSDSIELNFVPDLSFEGPLTADTEEVDAVKNDPFDISPIEHPDDSYANQDETDGDENEDVEAHYLTLQDLM